MKIEKELSVLESFVSVNKKKLQRAFSSDELKEVLEAIRKIKQFLSKLEKFERGDWL